ncbi:MAG: OmpA family protein [Proteiniphilum sp.]
MRSRFTYFLLPFTLLIAACGQANLSDARSHYLSGAYHAASEIYRELYRNTPRSEKALRGVIAFEMAENFRAINQSARAMEAYGNAIRLGYPDTMMYLSYARMLHRERKYSQALDAYRNFLMMQPDHPLAVNGIQGLLMAQQETPSRYEVQRMELFNSTRSEFSPMLTHRDKMLYFTSSREDVSGETKSLVTGLKFNDLFVAEKDVRGNWKKPTRLPDAINTEFDEGTPSFTTDGEWMYYTFSGTDSGKSGVPAIYCSKRVNGTWSAGRPLQLVPSDTLSLFAHPALSPSGSFLYFVSDMAGGMGGKDIWRVSVASDHVTGVPQNLGASVNTVGDEMFPYMRTDSTLYFSSDGHPGRGGLDLLVAKRTQNKEGWQVTSLPQPLNSSADDFGITFMRDAENGFFSSNRDDGRGYDHLYSFVYREATITVSGLVVDQEDESLPGAAVSVEGSDGSMRPLVTNRQGEYQFRAARDVMYMFTVEADGFIKQKQSLRTTSEEKDTLYYVDFEMIPYNKPVILEHIFYDYDRATLRSESKHELDKLAAILRENPEISIEIAAHTDRHGNEAYNRDLSARRAQAVLDYLGVSGIDVGRIQTVGRGKTEPMRVRKSIASQYDFLKEGDLLTEAFIEQLIPTQQAIADQINRRTEFRVLPPTFFNP